MKVKNGFLLIELMVALTIFSFLLLIVNKHSKNSQMVAINALDSFFKTIRQPGNRAVQDKVAAGIIIHKKGGSQQTEQLYFINNRLKTRLHKV